MSRIHQLTPEVINKIAAGEVIERPASVVKELLENSIDALATRVEIEVLDGGSELIRIVDNGEGIHPDDFSLAISSHATSKISSADELFSVQSMGFRGEALASIATVSRFQLRSRQEDSENGFEMDVHGGIAEPIQPCGCPKGTVIEVRQLFYNTPVRRKYLKTPGTEFGHVSEQFTRIALANPRVHAILKHNSKTVYELPSTDHFLDRIRLFYGKKLTDNLIWVESESDGIRLWGYVAHPSQTKSNRKGQYLFLNGRWIQDRSLQHALTESYRGLVMVGRHPICFLFMEMPADQVDVNVHPTKSEVRFLDSQRLYRQLLSTIRTRFLSEDMDSIVSLNGKKSESGTETDPVKQREVQNELAMWAKQGLKDWQPPAEGTPLVTESEGVMPYSSNPSAREGTTSGLSFKNEWNPEELQFRSGQGGTGGDADAGNQSGSAELGGNPDTVSQHSEIPRNEGTGLRVIQVMDCYLVAETEKGLTIIDQHALHERILYEYFRKRILEGGVESQRLLVPKTVELSPAESAILLEFKDLLGELGLGIEDFGNQTVLINRYPSMLKRVNLVQLVRDIAESLQSAGKSPTRRDLLDSLLHMMSCKAAIKSGQRLTDEEMISLLEQRDLIDDAHHCPHGRPTALNLTQDELDKQFGRLG